MGRTKHLLNISKIATASPVPSQNARDEAQQDPLLGKKKRPQSSSRVEGIIEPQQAVGPNQHEALSEEEGNNDAALRSIQVVASQTCKSVIEASRHNRPIKRKRGDVCCRKLIDLQPGEKLQVDFDQDCHPVGANSSIFTFYLGQTVRNRTCCPLAVPEWKYIESGRCKLKAKYYDDPELINRYQRENNKPGKVLKSDWLYLCTLWHDPQFQRQKNKKERTPAEILIESRKRKTTKPVNKEKLANNVDAVSKLEDYMKQRNEGMNQMDDEEIFKKVLGEEKHGYLRAYGRNKSITNYFGVKPTRLNLIHNVVEIEKKADEQVQETTRKMEEKMEEKLA
ncbi:hypothetical protein Cgig2_013798 [Carnegiea gigantea]|uniref:Uncharacterized protein n=1 Tax=Carnegiea gigantea TaxID=171969 RepID=A0A9Q1QBW7_9CARY|nr:hypothetical protein Cgig2_013798 [Carnegiea gigantea]